MTENRRIALNILATYGRSLFALALGLFSARWVFMTLGKVDFGLLGLVGGLSWFITFLNGVLAVSVSRFYAVSVGRRRTAEDDAVALEECRKWFSIALCLHAFLGVFLVSVGYPAGAWFIRNWLTIPPERTETCIWLFRFVCVSCFSAMVNVPFNAMYKAKQYIAELTVYGFAVTVVNFVFLCYMVSHPGDWLLRYGFWQCLLAVAPQVIITWRACAVFPECRFRAVAVRRGWRDAVELVSFTGWNFFGSLGNLVRTRAPALVVNRFFGPSANATTMVAASLSSHTAIFSGSLKGAFMPALASAWGAGDMERVKTLFNGICKYSSLLMLLVAVPVMAEADEITLLWLKDPPDGAAALGVFIMCTSVFEHMSMGHWMIMSASGRVALYQTLVGLCYVSALPVGWFAIRRCGTMGVGWTLAITLAAAICVRLAMVRRNFGIGPGHWLCRICIPTVAVSVAAYAAARAVSLFLEPSFSRVAVSALCAEAVFVPLVWFVVLDASEREYVAGNIWKILFRTAR